MEGRARRPSFVVVWKSEATPRGRGGRGRCSHPASCPRRPRPRRTGSRRAGSADAPTPPPGRCGRACRGRGAVGGCARSPRPSGSRAGPRRRTSPPRPRRPRRRSRRGAPARTPCSSGRRSRRASSPGAPSSARRPGPCRPHRGRRCTSSRSRDRSAGSRPRPAPARGRRRRPPASSRHTRTSGSSLSRAATTAPADPRPHDEVEAIGRYDGPGLGRGDCVAHGRHLLWSARTFDGHHQGAGPRRPVTAVGPRTGVYHAMGPRGRRCQSVACQRGGRFSANATAPSRPSPEENCSADSSSSSA